MAHTYETRKDFVAFEELYDYMVYSYVDVMDGLSNQTRIGFEALYLNPGCALKKFSNKYKNGDVSNTRIPRDQMSSALESLSHMEAILGEFSAKAVAVA